MLIRIQPVSVVLSWRMLTVVDEIRLIGPRKLLAHRRCVAHSFASCRQMSDHNLKGRRKSRDRFVQQVSSTQDGPHKQPDRGDARRTACESLESTAMLKRFKSIGRRPRALGNSKHDASSTWRRKQLDTEPPNLQMRRQNYLYSTKRADLRYE